MTNLNAFGRRYRTDYLFPRTGFWAGAGSALNLEGNYFTFDTAPSGEEADRKALACDWGMIGQDLAESIKALQPAASKPSTPRR